MAIGEMSHQGSELSPGYQPRNRGWQKVSVHYSPRERSKHQGPSALNPDL